MTNRSLGKWKLPQPIDLQEDNEWVKVPRISRTIPFGYELDTDDNKILIPIPDQLDKLDKAKKYLKQYSYREVANWLTTQTGRSISHVGLKKRIAIERRRKKAANIKRKLAKRLEETLAEIEKLEKGVTGYYTTREDTD